MNITKQKKTENIEGNTENTEDKKMNILPGNEPRP
jgi:hypothetical protein